MIITVPLQKKLRETILETSLFKARRLEIEPGQFVPWHYHTRCTDIILPIAGNAILKVEEEEIELLSNNFYIVEVNKKHSIENTGKNSFFYLLFQAGSYDFISCDTPSWG